MSIFTKLGVSVAAPINADGTPRQISPQDFQIWMTEVERLIKGLLANAGGVDLPELIYKYVITGGDQNNITAKPNAEVTAGAGEALFTIDITQPNTEDVTINGKPLLTSSGNHIVAGGLVPGIWLFLDDGVNFRLVSDQASQAIMNAVENALLATQLAQQASEEARDMAAGYASDAVSQGNVPIYSTLAAIASIEIPAGITAIRVNGRNGVGDGEGGLYIASNNGSSDTGTSGGATARAWFRVADIGVRRSSAAVSAGLRPDFLNRHRLRFEQFIPAGFPDGPDVISAKGLDRLYQQGVVFDESAGQVFRIFNANTGIDSEWAWIAVYNRDPVSGFLEYISCFSAGGRYNEGAIIHRIDGVRYLDISMGNGTNQIGRYNITTLPENQTRIHPSTTFSGIPIKVQMAGYGQDFLVEDNTTPFMLYRRKYVHQKYDSAWMPKGPVIFGMEVTGDDGDDFSRITELYPKSQGTSMSSDYIVHHVGGYYDISVGDKPYSNQGIRVCDTSGKLLVSVTLPGSKFAELLVSQGYVPERVETEGGYVTSEGRIFSYVMFRSGSSANQNLMGCAVVEWMATADDAINFSTMASQPTGIPVIHGRLINDVDPSSGDKFTLSTLLDFMGGRDIPHISFAAARFPGIVDLSGASFPAYALVQIDMLDNVSWRIRARNFTVEKEYQIYSEPRIQRTKIIRDEGVWIPSLKVGGSMTGLTYGVQSGSWKMANGIVTVDFRIELTSKGISEGAVTLGPLPIIPGNTNGSAVIVSKNMQGINGPVYLNSQVGGDAALYHGGAAGRVPLESDKLTNTSIFRGTIVYLS